MYLLYLISLLGTAMTAGLCARFELLWRYSDWYCAVALQLRTTNVNANLVATGRRGMATV